MNMSGTWFLTYSVSLPTASILSGRDAGEQEQSWHRHSEWEEGHVNTLKADNECLKRQIVVLST